MTACFRTWVQGRARRAGVAAAVALGLAASMPAAPSFADASAAPRTAGTGERALGGAELFEACAGCHSFAPGAAHRNGPNLWGIAGQPAASREGFTYSEALAASGFTWNRGTLTAWILATDRVLPGSWMVYHNTLAPDEVPRLVNYILGTPAD